MHQLCVAKKIGLSKKSCAGNIQSRRSSHGSLASHRNSSRAAGGSRTVWKHLRPTCGHRVGLGLRPALAHTSAIHLSSTVALFDFSVLTKLPARGALLKMRLLYLWKRRRLSSRQRRVYLDFLCRPHLLSLLLPLPAPAKSV